MSHNNARKDITVGAIMSCLFKRNKYLCILFEPRELMVFCNIKVYFLFLGTAKKIILLKVTFSIYNSALVNLFN